MKYLLLIILIIGAVALGYYFDAYSLTDAAIILVCGLIGGYCAERVTQYLANKKT